MKKKLKLKNKYEYLYTKLMPSVNTIIVGNKLLQHSIAIITNFGVFID